MKKLVKKENGKPDKIVYLLYDLHVTHVPNEHREKCNSAGEALLKKAKTLDQTTKRLEFSSKYNEKISTLKDPLEKYLDMLPNLKKQHDDLKNVVRQLNISIIAEDWPLLENLFAPKTEKELTTSFTYTGNKFEYALLGLTKKYTGSFIEMVTPLLRLGKSLTGKFSSRKLMLIPEQQNTYFYNPDNRSEKMKSEEDDRAIDTDSIHALEKLFEKGVDKVIIAEGAVHCINIAQNLMDNGFTASGVIIHDELIVKSNSTHGKLKGILAGLNENNQKTVNAALEDLENLIMQYPLNVREVFEKELGVKIEQKKETPVEQPKPKNTEDKRPTTIPQEQKQTATTKQAVQNNNSLFGVNTESITCFVKSAALSLVTGGAAWWVSNHINKQIKTTWRNPSNVSIGLSVLTSLACAGMSVHSHFKIINPTQKTLIPWFLGAVTGTLPSTCIGQRLLKSIRLR